MNTISDSDQLIELKDEIKKNWILLDDDDLSFIQDKTDYLTRLLQNKYGFTKDRAHQEITTFKREHKNFFHDKRGTFNQEIDMTTSGQFSESMDKNKLRTRAAHLIEEDIIEPTQQYIARAKELGARAIDRSADIVRENPGYTIMGAAALGFLVGAYISRRK